MTNTEYDEVVRYVRERQQHTEFPMTDEDREDRWTAATEHAEFQESRH